MGLGTAWQLQKLSPGLKIILLEKEPVVAAHQSTHNSGVLHAGLYYTPGSEKARLCVEGLQIMTAFCRENSVPHEICGKIVLATRDEQLPRLENLFERGQQNGLQGLRKLGPEEIREREPHAKGVAAIHVPQEGIVDYQAVADRLVEKIKALGGDIHLSTKVLRIREKAGRIFTETTSGDFESDYLVNCGGLYCDKVLAAAGLVPEVKIIPFRGEYYKLRPERQSLVKHLIYPVPDPAFPFLGVHFTRLIEGGVEAGPNAVLAFAREGYGLTKINLAEFAESITFPGLWKFMLQYKKMVWHELRQSSSQKRFCQSLQVLVPDVQPEDLSPGGAGVRAQAMSRDGKLVNDFVFQRHGNSLHVLNAPSPAATASLAIGKRIANELLTA